MKVKHDNKNWKLESTSKKISLWRWERTWLGFLWGGLALSLLVILAVLFVNGAWAMAFIFIVPLYLIVVGGNSTDQFNDCKQRLHLHYEWKDAAANFLSITDGPYVKLAQDSLRTMIAECFDEENYSSVEWVKASNRLVARAKKERSERRSPSSVGFLHDFLDGLDMLDADCAIKEAPDFDLFERSLIPPRPRKKVKA